MKANEPTNEIKNEEKAEESKGEKVSETFDIKDMANLLVDKTTIGTHLLAQIDKFNFD